MKNQKTQEFIPKTRIDMNLFAKIRWLLVGNLILFGSLVSAQDLILTLRGDSINAKITQENATKIFFTYKREKEFVRTSLPKHLVKTFRYGYFRVAEVPADDPVLNQVLPRFRGGVYGGWSNRIEAVPANLPPELDNYFSGLKTGFHYGGDVASYFSEGLGFGFRYSASRYSNESEITLMYEDGTSETGILRDNMAIHYAGPFFSARIYSVNKQNCFVMNFGAGLISYRNRGMVIDPLTIEGSAFGISWDFAYDIGISKNLALGIQAGLVFGNLKQYEVSYRGQSESVTLSKGDYDNLSRLDLSMGLRFVK